eukprot:scaffold67214_cov53-Attheya_sp.AAC.4
MSEKYTNKGFPRPAESSKDEDDEGVEEGVVSQFVFQEVFPRVVVLTGGPSILFAPPPPIDSIIGNDDSGQTFVRKRRHFSYLCSILRSWQLGILAQDIRPFPTKDDVRKAFNTTGKVQINYDHHDVMCRSSYFVAARDAQNTLVIHLANDGYLYIHDAAMVAVPVQLEKTNDRHTQDPLGLGWAVFKPQQHESAMAELQPFTDFAKGWFKGDAFRSLVLYNAEARRVDICFQSKNEVGIKIALEFSFERDWSVTDESNWWW